MHLFPSTNFKVSLGLALFAFSISESASISQTNTVRLPPPFEHLEVTDNGCPSNWSEPLLLPHENTCEKYYACSNGRRVRMLCSPGTAFNFVRQVCDWPEYIQCFNLSKYIPEDHTAPVAINNDFQEAEKAPKASNIKNKSPETSDISIQTTTDSRGKREWISDPSAILESCKSCTLTSQFFPFACNCRFFFRCVKGLPVLDSCPSGLMFNAELGMCDFPKNVACSQQCSCDSDSGENDGSHSVGANDDGDCGNNAESDVDNNAQSNDDNATQDSNDGESGDNSFETGDNSESGSDNVPDESNSAGDNDDHNSNSGDGDIGSDDDWIGSNDDDSSEGNVQDQIAVPEGSEEEDTQNSEDGKDTVSPNNPGSEVEEDHPQPENSTGSQQSSEENDSPNSEHSPDTVSPDTDNIPENESDTDDGLPEIDQGPDAGDVSGDNEVIEGGSNPDTEENPDTSDGQPPAVVIPDLGDSHESDEYTETDSDPEIDSSLENGNDQENENPSENIPETDNVPEHEDNQAEDNIPEYEHYPEESDEQEDYDLAPEADTQVICPPGFFGNVADPNSCDSFYFCTGGTSIHLFCQSGQEYNATTGVCEPIRGDVSSCATRRV